MPTVAVTSVGDLARLLTDWKLHLRAKGSQPATIASYLAVGTTLTGYLTAQGMPTAASAVTREHVEHYLADLRDRVAPATAAKHYRSLQQLFRWLTDEGETTRSPMERMTAPAVPEQPVPVLDDDTLAKLLATATGNTCENRRDTAIIRLLLDTGMRCGELIAINLDDVDWDHQVVHVLGKGNRGRACPFGAKTGEAIRRYQRLRARHPMATATPRLWLGKKGPFTDSGVRQMLERRCAAVGVAGAAVGGARGVAADHLP
jgi:site-specific recombinase XerD